MFVKIKYQNPLCQRNLIFPSVKIKWENYAKNKPIQWKMEITGLKYA